LGKKYCRKRGKCKRKKEAKGRKRGNGKQKDYFKKYKKGKNKGKKGTIRVKKQHVMRGQK
jgi:hypothetical protein